MINLLHQIRCQLARVEGQLDELLHHHQVRDREYRANLRRQLRLVRGHVQAAEFMVQEALVELQKEAEE
jgi:hypothetical protein